MRPDVLFILTHDASLLDVLGFFHTADLTSWEKLPLKKDNGQEISLQGYSREAGLERRYNGLILAAQAVCLIIMYVSHSSGYIAI